MLEITPADIASLPDDVLRELVGRLCEATVRDHGLPASGVTWSGSQDAGDGGIDVRVDLNADISGFIPAKATGYQVKKPAMRAADIVREMQPKGVLRPSIQELADASGAYIIVSSAASVSDSALKQRRQAMRSALTAASNGSQLIVDFYDQRRLVTWLRDYPALIPWAREKAGRPIEGWRSYGGWSIAPEGGDPSYLTDEQVRLQIRGDDSNNLTAVQGLDYVRELLKTPGKSVRLVGLSGVGKTRFVEALFEDIGRDPLHPSMAIYSDAADTPTPLPAALVSTIIAEKKRLIVVLDNCPADTHRRLTELCRGAGSTVSLLTIEYDIRDDEPEGSEAIKLEASSARLIERLVRIHVPKLSADNAKAIANSDISGGNARIALALARTLRAGESITRLNDAELFKRLFQQRNDPDQHLLRAAEVCALVYSFDAETQNGEQAELPLLAELAGHTATELFRHVATLKARDLVQQRGRWRALLPHAIANRLAKSALRSVPAATLESILIDRAPERLARSFSRRLGYLNDCEEATLIARRWLAPGGLLADIEKLSFLGLAMVANIAPLAPEETLCAIERHVDRLAAPSHPGGGLTHPGKLQKLVFQIAYDAALFERCCKILARLASFEEPSENNDSVGSMTRTLFQARISGTHASVGQRLSVIRALVRSADEKMRILGERLLLAMLQTSGFSARTITDFGMIARDYGYEPRTPEQVKEWFSRSVDTVIEILKDHPALASGLRKRLALPLRGLCQHAKVFDDVERLVEAVSATGYWQEAWLSVRYVIRREEKKENKNEDDLRRLHVLLEKLQPSDLSEQVKSIVFSGSGSALDIVDLEDGEDGNFSDAIRRVGRASEELGRAVAGDEQALAALLPQMVTEDGTYLVDFGRGLALSCENPASLLASFRAAFAAASEKDRNVRTMIGVLTGLQIRDAAFLERFLDEAVEDEVFGRQFPLLQATLALTDNAIVRLRRALAVRAALAWQYRSLGFGSVTKEANPLELARLLQELAQIEGGRKEAIDILAMHFHLDGDAKRAHDEALLEVGRLLLQELEFDSGDEGLDYNIGQIAAACLRGPEQKRTARKIMNSFMQACTLRYASSYRFDEFQRATFKAQPMTCLDACFLGQGRDRNAWSDAFDDDDPQKTVLSEVPTDILLRWCQRAPRKRFVLAATHIPFCSKLDEGKNAAWTEAALALLRAAPDKRAVLEKFISRFRPNAWSGSRADIMRRRAETLLILDPDNELGLRATAQSAYERLKQDIAEEREREIARERDRSETFER